MCSVPGASVLSAVLVYLLTYSTVKGDGCLSSQSDPGALYIKQLRAAVDEAECQLVEDITYTDYNPSNFEEFDFIVVGAGSAGSVVANRLSENPNWKVLLLEAGGDPTITSEIPSIYRSVLNTDLDWGYKTEPEPINCLGMVNGRCPWNRGKVLGGSSTINGMLYVRGQPRDYDGWERMGNPGWQYKYVLYYFKKSEDLRAVSVLRDRSSSGYHRKGGYLKVESFDYDEFYLDTFSEAFKELGLETFDDVNAQVREGFFTFQGTLENARRCSTAKAFLHDFQRRTNLKISKYSFVSKILMKGDIAYGVEVTKRGKTFAVIAKKEVILSAGSINTPQLLMLSGIGPRDHLEELGIEVIRDLKVGYNLQDQLVTRCFLISLDIPTPKSDILENTFEFLVESKGPFATDSFSIGGYFKTSHGVYPDTVVFFSPYPVNSTAELKKSLTTMGFNAGIQRSILKINSRKSILFVTPSFLNPKSRGRILLRSKNPQDYPLIYPGYFSNTDDLEDGLDGIRFANEFARSKTLKDLGAVVERIDIPGCEPFPFQTRSYWECALKHMTVTAYHHVGTCMMGPRENPDSVVDPLLRVIGIKNLRVVDASIMPTVTTGNTNAPTIAIAEKGSDLIKQFWNKNKL